MQELGKDPRWYSLRSIRQGASTTACEMNMPEVFLRATGGWKGNAVELYRKDRLPKVQGQFAQLLKDKAEYDLRNYSSPAQDPRRRPVRCDRGRRWSLRAVIAPRRLPPRISGEPAGARRDGECDSEYARWRGTSSLPARSATYELLGGKCRSGQDILMPVGGGLVGDGMTF